MNTILDRLVHAMRESGMAPTKPSDIKANGEICRFNVQGDKPGRKNGWVVLHAEGKYAAAVFGSWRLGVRHHWASNSFSAATPAKQAGFRALIERKARAEETRRATGWEKTARIASRRLRKYSRATPSAPYLRARGVSPHGILQSGRVLIIPLRDVDGKVWTYQKIWPNGKKRFLKGGKKRGCFYALGGTIKYNLILAEGFATAASVFEATRIPTFMAVDAGNLEPVAAALRAKYPLADIIIAADDDAETEESDGINPGIVFAEKAARSVNGRVAYPRREGAL